MLATVDALFPLSLLEAVRNVDTPMRSSRHGIRRRASQQTLRPERHGLHADQTSHRGGAKGAAHRLRRSHRPRQTDRPAAGRRGGVSRRGPIHGATILSNHLVAQPQLDAAFCRRPSRGRWLSATRRKSPRGTSAATYGGSAAFLMVDVPRSITLGTAPGSIGCTYYEASLRELLQRLIGSIGAVEHVRCAARGEGTCEWRADWRAIDRTAGFE